MTQYGRRSWLDAVLTTALTLLFAALALFVAAKLIAAVALVLLITLGLAAGLTTLFYVWRWHSGRGW